MKKLYSSMIAIIALVVFAGVATAKPPSWDKVINSPERFKVLSQFNDEAVLDKETGLVWEQSPSTITRTYLQALKDCYEKIVGDRGGWRLPTVEELMSLVDLTNDPTLPNGNPFEDVGSSFYWSATKAYAVNPSFVRGVFFTSGSVLFSGKGGLALVWCVRGGQGYDGF